MKTPSARSTTPPGADLSRRVDQSIRLDLPKGSNLRPPLAHQVNLRASLRPCVASSMRWLKGSRFIDSASAGLFVALLVFGWCPALALAAPPGAVSGNPPTPDGGVVRTVQARNQSAPAAGAPALASPAPTPLVAPAPFQDQGQEEPQPEADQKPPTLESRIPPVSTPAFTKVGKFELTVGVGLSVNDAFLEKFIPELSLGYHFNDSFYLGLRGGYAFDVSAGHVNACDQSGTVCGGPTPAQLKSLPGNITAAGSVEFGWSPIYGKLNLFGEKVLHFDTSLLLGGGILVLGPQPDPALASVVPQLSPGIGQRFFFSSAFAVAAEFRDILYASGGVQNQLVFHLGLTFLL